MAKAMLNNVVLAESDTYEVVEGNIYFPPESLKKEYFEQTDKHTTCAWKGQASYYTIDIDGQKTENAAWTYPEPKDAAKNIKEHVAFDRSVDVTS